MNIKKHINSINFKTLSYLVLFSVGLLLLLWIFQIAFLKIFYEKYQMKSITNIANGVANFSDGDVNVYLENIAYQNNICIQLLDNDGLLHNFNTKMNGCLLGINNHFVTQYKNELLYDEKDSKAIKLVNPDNEVKSFLYGVRRSDGYVYLNSTLEDVNATSKMLRGQLIYITIIAILFAILVAYFLSGKLTKPIVNITKKAKKLGEGNYDVVFEKNGISEIDDLAETLGYVEAELSKTDELRRDLMANVSHDLKTPLTMIKAYAEMVRDLSYKDKKKREEHLNIIIDETDRLNVLVNDILSLSKMQADAESLEINAFDLAKEIDTILKRYEIIKETEDYSFVVEKPETCMVKADKNKINQVLYNLINNAINYTGDDKIVKIKVVEAKSDYLVEISDTGKGIDAKDIKHIWDKYYKKEKNHKRNVVGTGLGLSIVKHILIRHNFPYGVNSKKKKGTTFYFRIKKAGKM